MKKFIGTVAMAPIFMLILSSFTAVEKQSQTIVKKDCNLYASESAYEEIQTYGPMSSEEYNTAFFWYYDACMDVGGNIDVPVFVEG